MFDNYYDGPNYKGLAAVWLNKTFKERYYVSVLGIADGFQHEDGSGKTPFRYTAGGHFKYEHKQLRMIAKAFSQAGEIWSGQKVSAWFAALNFKYQWDKWNIGAGIDYFSGADTTDNPDNKIGTFSIPYATNHIYYGLLDFFTNIPANTLNGGLNNLFVRAGFRPNGKSNIELTYHYFALSGNVLDVSNEPLSKYLGSEIDFTGSYKYNEFISFKLGYSMMVATESMEAIKGGDKDEWTDWGWAMVVINPVLFMSK